jgi:hypothetical protein
MNNDASSSSSIVQHSDILCAMEAFKDECYEGCFSGNSSIIVRGRLSNHSFIAVWS